MTDPGRRQRFAATVSALVAALLVPEPAFAASDDPPAMPAPVETAFARLPDRIDDWAPDGTAGAIAMQMFPLVGREDLVVRFDPDAYRHRSCAAVPGEPIAALDAAARDAQIVIVNEAHDQPLHRWVIRELGVALAERFDVFAAETFGHEALAERVAGRVTDRLGTYSDEPVFGRELRALDAAGYAFAAYEIRAGQRRPDDADVVDQVVAREEAQAANLIAGVLERDPEARILVHVGYSHALEKPVVNWNQEVEWFAARLKRKTGIDPLTVSQTHCSLDAADADNAFDGLRLVDGSEAVERPGAIDRFLAHPPLRFDDGRPAWRRAIGDFEVPVPESFRSDRRRVIVEARAPGDPLDEVPTDRLLLYPGESLPLLLPEGTWMLRAWRDDGRALPPVRIAAAPPRETGAR